MKDTRTSLAQELVKGSVSVARVKGKHPDWVRGGWERRPKGKIKSNFFSGQDMGHQYADE